MLQDKAVEVAHQSVLQFEQLKIFTEPRTWFVNFANYFAQRSVTISRNSRTFNAAAVTNDTVAVHHKLKEYYEIGI